MSKKLREITEDFKTNKSNQNTKSIIDGILNQNPDFVYHGSRKVGQHEIHHISNNEYDLHIGNNGDKPGFSWSSKKSGLGDEVPCENHIDLAKKLGTTIGNMKK